jgi:hypothetical protein
MDLEIDALLRKGAINGWRLFWLVTCPISAAMIVAMIVAMVGAGLSSGEGVSSMIQLSVRCAVPLLYLAFAASSLQILLPSPLGRWLLRNRKYVGLCFAAAMAWQLLFIVWMVGVHTDYYVSEVYVLRDAIEGVTGYLFLIAMTVTSFKPGRRLLTAKQWRLLHKSGIYFLWAYAFSVYWWALFYYQNPVWIDYVFYWSGLLAWCLRAAAWRQQRWRRARKSEAGTSLQPLKVLLAIAATAAIVVGLIAASFGSSWREPVEGFLMGTAFTKTLELYLPYWPFTPFLPLFVIGLGALLTTSFARRSSH